MNLEIQHVVLRRTDLRTRLPFRYGIATMEHVPHVFVEVCLRLGNREQRGLAADHLPPKWFTKDPDRPVAEEIREMEAVVRKAAQLAQGLRVATVFDGWFELHHRMEDARKAEGWPPLLAQFGTSLIERGLIDAFCRAGGLPFAQALRAGALGLRLEEIHPELRGAGADQLLPGRSLESVALRHTVGLADPIDREDDAPRIDDGLPETLQENIAAYGLTHFKVKFTGRPDLPRLERIFATLQSATIGKVCFTLDGNESFSSVEAFREAWATIERLPCWPGLHAGLMCVEQPFHRDVALDATTTGALLAWPERPPLIIDESDAEFDSVRRALAGGYIGTSHKNCKGVFKGISNACLLAKRRTSEQVKGLLQTGEDLANIGPVALLQDLAVQATLGITSVERNGHHYFRGLSFLPANLQAQVLAAHPDLYHRHERKFPTLTITNGKLDVRSVAAAPFGVDFAPDLSAFPRQTR